MTTLTLKPGLLRADTIDLQSHDNPSAKDHTRGQYHPGYSHTGAHHAQSLRNANHDALREQQHSPRLEGFNQSHLGPQGQTHMYDDEDEHDDDDDDRPHHGMNGVSPENGYGDEEGDSQDEDMDDELLDKISSSPSIEDGKQPWPTRADSLHYGHPQRPQSAPTRGISFHCPSPGSSPRSGGPIRQEIESHQSQHGSPHKYGGGFVGFGNGSRLSPTRNSASAWPNQGLILTTSSSIENIDRHFLPEDDPFLDDPSEDDLDSIAPHDNQADWEDEDEDEETVEDSETSDDDQDDFLLEAEPRFVDSGWGGECLREIEDIDFEFVYALHTFVATVEGQANATKGDTMVLLDDTNSYWWLVRVVKDGSIGYLPAEHIETPTERLARLNKHRNIDLSAAMLGDNPEKSKNPLKKAIRRRNAKTVNFAPPTYYEPEYQEWSDEEDDDEADDDGNVHIENTASEQDQQATEQAQSTQQARQTQQAQTADTTTEQQRAQPAAGTIHHIESNDEMDDDEPSSPGKPEVEAPAPLQTSSQDNVQRSRNGTLRNTDSFFKDQETKKMTLTPRLLRNDNDSMGSTEQEVKQRPSLDTFDKIAADEKSKDNKKKEKKGMLSGLFKRKDKGGKGSKNDADETDRTSEDSGRSPMSKDSMDSDHTPERKPSKLQKPPPVAAISPRTSPTDPGAPQREFASIAPQQQPQAAPQNQPDQSQTQPSQHLAPEQQNQPSRFPSLQEKRSVFAPITGALRSKNSSQDMGESTIKPVYSRRAKERFAIDDSDSEGDSTPTAHSSILHRSISPVENDDVNAGRPGEAIRESPLESQEPAKQPPTASRSPLAEVNPLETHEQERMQSQTPTSTSDQTASTSKHSPSIPSHTPSTSRSTPTWSDASLRSYMDNDQDIRDLLVIVHDKTNVKPVGPDHPLMNGLFATERTKLADMQSQLDSMLISWLSKKNQPILVKI